MVAPVIPNVAHDVEAAFTVIQTHDGVQAQLHPDKLYTLLKAMINRGTIFPQTDPHVLGEWWDNAGTLTRSAGPI